MLSDLYAALDPVAFAIGPFSVRWYGLAYIAGFLAAISIVYVTAKRWRLKFTLDDLCIVLIMAMLGVIVGGRLGYVVAYNFDYYVSDPLAILQINQGGMSFHGGLVGALIGGGIASRILHMPYLSLIDLCVIGVPIGLALGRCANFVNGELWGAPTDLPWGVVFGGHAGTMPRHPSQLYEALLEGVVLFIILFALSRKQPPYPRGTFTGVFMLGYGIVRILVEFVRQPDAQIGYLFGGWFTMGMLLSVPLVIGGACLLFYAYSTKHPQIGPNRVLSK